MSLSRVPERYESVEEYVTEHIARLGYAPTVSEMSRALGISKSGVCYCLNRLICEGKLTAILPANPYWRKDKPDQTHRLPRGLKIGGKCG